MLAVGMQETGKFIFRHIPLSLRCNTEMERSSEWSETEEYLSWGVEIHPTETRVYITSVSKIRHGMQREPGTKTYASAKVRREQTKK